MPIRSCMRSQAVKRKLIHMAVQLCNGADFPLQPTKNVLSKLEQKISHCFHPIYGHSLLEELGLVQQEAIAGSQLLPFLLGDGVDNYN